MYRNLLNYLKLWVDDPIRTPLIIRGARQVGKSHLVREFGKSVFAEFVDVNLETNPEFLPCFAGRNPRDICTQIETIKNQNIVPSKTLLFIDEIQYSKDALLSLRSFKEQMPDLHVIAAGSLLEFALQDAMAPSFPVGRVTFAQLYPISFLEFLNAMDEPRLIGQIQAASLGCPPAPAIHKRLLDLLRTYFVVGGMPEVLETLRLTKSVNEAKRVQNRLMTTFIADFAKYGGRYDHRKLQQLLAAVPQLVGKKFKYVHVDPNTKARDFKRPLLDLERAGLVRLIRATAANGLPLGAEEKEGAFKTQFLDVGLMLHSLGIDLFASSTEAALFVNEGALAEQFVGQELLANANAESMPQLHYWARDTKGSEAEVDFVFPYNGQVIPIEVKAGTTGRLRSLRQFMIEKKRPVGIRISQKDLSLNDDILSIPLYAVSEINRILDSII